MSALVDLATQRATALIPDMDQTQEEWSRWFVRSRWAAVIGALVVVGVAHVLGSVLNLAVLFTVIAVHAASNIALQISSIRSRRALGFVLLVDVLILTVLLHFSGGPSNPFAALYFVHVTMAAVLFGSQTTAATWVASVISYGGLFVLDGAGHGHAHHHGAYQSHLYGMLAAFAATSAVLGFFVARLSAALRDRDRELRIAQERAARASRVASLTTLAAGAAHELGSPLGTIAVVAGELARADLGDHAEDIELIRQELRRCRSILDSMSVSAGEVSGEAPVEVGVEVLFDDVRKRLSPERAARMTSSGQGSVSVPRSALAQALTTLVENAFDASPSNASIELSFRDRTFEVQDQGAGMDAETLSRATEPFFTTKDGEGATGMGLGLFLASEIANALGGALELVSSPDGTTARLVLSR